MKNPNWVVVASVGVWFGGLALIARAGDPVETAVESPASARIAQLVRQLDDDSYEVREQATQQLVELGRPAVEALADSALSDSPEAAWRATVALEQIGIAGDEQTVADVCRALERISRDGNRTAAKTRTEMYARWRSFRHDRAAEAIRRLGGQLSEPQSDYAMGGGELLFGGGRVAMIDGGFGPVIIRDLGGPIAIAEAIEVHGLEFGDGGVVDAIPIDPEAFGIPVEPAGEDEAHDHEHEGDHEHGDHRHDAAVEPAVPADDVEPIDEARAEPATDSVELGDGELTAELIDRLIKEKLGEAPEIVPDVHLAEGGDIDVAIAVGGFGPPMGFAPAPGGGVVLWDVDGTARPGGVLRLDKSWKGSDDDLALLKDLAGVSLLELRDFTVTDEAIKHIALMRDLRRVTITNTQYPPLSLLALKKARPELNVLAVGDALLGVSGNMGEREGFTVNTVVPETGAGKAGLQPGDVITTIDGHDVRGFDSLTILVAYKKVGQTIDLVFKRGDKTLSATATLGPRPDVLP